MKANYLVKAVVLGEGFVKSEQTFRVEAETPMKAKAKVEQLADVWRYLSLTAIA
jgi:hypothetical protein